MPPSQKRSITGSRPGRLVSVRASDRQKGLATPVSSLRKREDSGHQPLTYPGTPVTLLFSKSPAILCLLPDTDATCQVAVFTSGPGVAAECDHDTKVQVANVCTTFRLILVSKLRKGATLSQCLSVFCQSLNCLPFIVLTQIHFAAESCESG